MQILILAVIIVIGAGAAWFVSTNTTNESPTDDTTVVAEQEVADDTPAEMTTQEVAVAPVDTPTITEAPPIETITSIAPPAEPQLPTQQYADGTYTETGDYISPAGKEEIEISLTLQNDIVTAATFTGLATNPGSIKNQEKFAAGFEAEVIGKPLDSIKLTVVNGSSLTPKGFMDALVDIKAAAEQS